jgi:hypothetical protein
MPCRPPLRGVQGQAAAVSRELIPLVAQSSCGNHGRDSDDCRQCHNAQQHQHGAGAVGLLLFRAESGASGTLDRGVSVAAARNGGGARGGVGCCRRLRCLVIESDINIADLELGTVAQFDIFDALAVDLGAIGGA